MLYRSSKNTLSDPNTNISLSTRCVVSEGLSHHSLQLLLFFRNRCGETSCEIVHFYRSWLPSQCYPWICVLLSWVSKHRHGCQPEKRAERVHHISVQQNWNTSKSSIMSGWCYLSECILSVTTGSVSFFSRSHMWRLEAPSSTQKTAGLVWAHCSETTGSPAVLLFHSATGCSWLTMCSLMLPSPQPTWNKDAKKISASLLCLWQFDMFLFKWCCVEFGPVCPMRYVYWCIGICWNWWKG